MARTLLISPSRPRKCKTAALRQNSDATKISLACRWKFVYCGTLCWLRKIVKGCAQVWLLATMSQIFVNPQRAKDLEGYLKTLPKGAKVVSRHLVTWGVLLAARQGNKAKFLEVIEGATVEKQSQIFGGYRRGNCREIRIAHRSNI